MCICMCAYLHPHVDLYVYIDRRTDGHTSYSVSFVRVKSLNLTIRESIRMKSGGSKKTLYVLESDEVARTDERMDGWKRDQMTHQNNC